MTLFYTLRKIHLKCKIQGGAFQVAPTEKPAPDYLWVKIVMRDIDKTGKMN